MKIFFKQTKWNFIFLFLATLGSVLLTGCDEENGLPYYDDNSLDNPYLFSDGYEDKIQHPYALSTPLTDWLSMVRDEVKVCKLSI
ncbi:MAG: hypothetical protein II677_03135, partial [Muribaculaceae bacterium]|nr:hypothetical protein [Muribaculaceae bacterium]